MQAGIHPGSAVETLARQVEAYIKQAAVYDIAAPRQPAQGRFCRVFPHGGKARLVHALCHSGGLHAARAGRARPLCFRLCVHGVGRCGGGAGLCNPCLGGVLCAGPGMADAGCHAARGHTGRCAGRAAAVCRTRRGERRQRTGAACACTAKRRYAGAPNAKQRGTGTLFFQPGRPSGRPEALVGPARTLRACRRR